MVYHRPMLFFLNLGMKLPSFQDYNSIALDLEFLRNSWLGVLKI